MFGAFLVLYNAALENEDGDFVYKLGVSAVTCVRDCTLDLTMARQLY